jgi:hypothetical protein
MNINDFLEDDQSNPASIETTFYRNLIPIDTKTYALDLNFETFLEIFNQPQSTGYKFSSLCDDEIIDKSLIKGENQITQAPSIEVTIILTS